MCVVQNESFQEVRIISTIPTYNGAGTDLGRALGEKNLLSWHHKDRENSVRLIVKQLEEQKKSVQLAEFCKHIVIYTTCMRTEY